MSECSVWAETLRVPVSVLAGALAWCLGVWVWRVWR